MADFSTDLGRSIDSDVQDEVVQLLVADLAAHLGGRFRIGGSPAQAGGRTRLVTARRGLRSGVNIRLVFEDSTCVWSITPASRIESLATLAVLLLAGVAGIAGVIGFGAAFTPRYLHWSGIVGTVVACAAGALAALTFWRMVSQWSDRQMDPGLMTSVSERVRDGLKQYALNCPT